MDWKETVMDGEKISDMWHVMGHSDSNDGSWHYLFMTLRWIIEAQAKISYKIGYDEALGQLADMTVEIRGDVLKQLRDFNQRGLTITKAIELLQ